MNRIGEKIKSLRNEKGMTQKVLAKKLGVSESFINEIESGRKVASEGIITRVSKIFDTTLDDVNTTSEDKTEKATYEPQRAKTKVNEKTNEVWDNAFGSILKNVPIYKKDLKTVITVKQLPLISNKVEGYAQDKVFYLQIEDNDMIGFRISEGDLAFSHISHEIENNAICLIEYNDNRIVRQIKKLDNNKVLLISNSNTLMTETAYIKDVKVLAKLDKLEIKL